MFEEFNLSKNTTKWLESVEKDFVCGELTLIYAREKDKTRPLIFAVLELLHQGVECGTELPTGMGNSCQKISKAHEVNLRRVHLSVAQALAWYQHCAIGQGTIPPVTSEKQPGQSPLTLNLPLFSQEPAYPHITLETEQSFWNHSIPFWGYRLGGIRRHQLIAETPYFGINHWQEKDRKKAREWLNEVFPIDIFERPCLLNSIHLVLTNPIFGQVSIQLDKENRKQIHVAIQLWPGKRVENLFLLVREERPNGTTLVETFPINSSRITLKLGFEPHQVSFEIFSKNLGLLYTNQPFTFVRQIDFSLKIKTGIRQIAVPPSSRRRSPESYTVPQYEAEPKTTIGKANLPSALEKLIIDKFEYKQRYDALQLGQCWFDGNSQEATRLVRKIIQNAEETVFIVDAYFGYLELLRYALATVNKAAMVKILTSKEYLKNSLEQGDSENYAHLLSTTLEQIKAQDTGVNIEIRVGKGQKAPVHDRFIVLDNKTVWLVGSSLNELGSRGTMMVKLPHSQPIIEALNGHWDDADSLDHFIKKDPNQEVQ